MLGPSGAGKSTLLRLLALLARPDAGEVRVDGAPARPEHALRMALVAQRAALFRMSAVDNVFFGLRARGRPEAEMHSAARAAMERLGVWALRDQPARRLSAGEQQRVALARALVLGPEALLLDEATAHLDPANARLIEGEVRRQARLGCAVVAATHDLPAARRVADRVLLLVDGRVREAAPARDFFAKPASPEGRAFLDAARPSPDPGPAAENL